MAESPSTSTASVSHLSFAPHNANPTGRTARIGNEGIATSFFSDRDSDIAPDLVKILVECKQKVPDFLEPYRPGGDRLEFDDDTDDESGEKKDDNGERAWGGGLPMEPTEESAGFEAPPEGTDFGWE